MPTSPRSPGGRPCGAPRLGFCPLGLCLLALTLTASGCDDAGGGSTARLTDAGADSAVYVDAELPADADDLGPDASPDQGVDAGAALRCVRDADCVEPGAYCEAGECRAAPPGPFAMPIRDGVTRAAATSLEITPDYLEPWHDRAGPDCPQNRAGRYDGRVDGVAPAPCTDTFDDANGDGVFDTVWLGGTLGARPATGVANDNPPAGRVLLLTRDEVLRVLITLDVYAVDAARVEDLQRRLSLRLGTPAGTILVHATGTRHGPDAVGLMGPGPDIGGGADAFFARAGTGVGLLGTVPYASGVNERWWDQVVTRIAAAGFAARANLVPVATRHATTDLQIGAREAAGGPITVPDANEDGRINDAADLAAFRRRTSPLSIDDALPSARDARLHSVMLEARSTGAPVAVLVGWGAADAHLGAAEGRLSAGFPGRVRAEIEAATPGATAIWLTSAASDTVVFDERVFMPRIGEMGELLDADGGVVDHLDEAAEADDPVEAMGRYLSHSALRGLADAPVERAEMTVRSRYVWVPLRNPRFGVAARLGVLGPLGGWLSGRSITPAWSPGTSSPACGGLGCARYRMDLISLGQLDLLTTPGALASGFVQGLEDATLDLPDQRNLRDLDGDGTADIDDPEIRVMTRSGGREVTVSIAGPANPQRFTAVDGLASNLVWVVGRVNGGVGTFRSAWSALNVFEGSAESFMRFAAAPENAAINLCAAGYPCTGELTVGELARRTAEAQPVVLADLTGFHELQVAGPALVEVEVRVDGWRIEDAEGAVRVYGGRLEIGPGDRVFTPTHNLLTAGVQVGDALVVEGDPDRRWSVVGLAPVVLAEHPNAGDAWLSVAPDGGDLIYNVACELVFDGVCPHRREVFGADPNVALPRSP